MGVPPSDFGAVMLNVAVPAFPTTTDLMDGDAGGPIGLCHSAVVSVFELHEASLLMV